MRGGGGVELENYFFIVKRIFMKISIPLIIILCTCILSACTSHQDVIKAHFSCAYVASQLGKTEAEEIVLRKMNNYAIEHNLPQLSARDGMFLYREVVTDDLQVHRYGMEALIDEYNSSKCMKLHEQEKFDIKKELQKLEQEFNGG